MTMMITKFNKLIANKYVWIGFTFLIVLAFVAWDMSIPEETQDAANRQVAGTLFGQDITQDELRSAYRHTYMGLVLSFNQMFPIDEELDAELTSMAWKRVASLLKAEQMGIRASNDEVVQAIRGFPDFHHEGQFHPQIYQSFTEQYLPAMGFRPADFERHVRQELILQKLQRMVTESVLISPSEIDRAIHHIGDEFVIDYVRITDDVIGEGVDVTEEEMREYFEANPDQFEIPPMISVRLVRFPIADFRERVEVTEDEALEFYDRHIDDFVIVETEVPDDPELGEDWDDELFQVTTTQPFEDVREEIFDRLRDRHMVREAIRSASDFVRLLEPDRDGVAESTFEEAAQAFGLEIEITAPFERDMPPAGIEPGPAFSREAAMLEDHPRYYFSNPIEGEDHIYVMALDEVFRARTPAFEEVEEAVRTAALAYAREREARTLAETFKEMVDIALQEGRAFADVAEELALPIEQTVSFSAAEGLQDVPYGGPLLRAVLAFNEGEVTDPVEADDAVIVAYLRTRTLTNVDEFADLRPQIAASLTRERGRILFDEWQAQLLREAGFTPRTPARAPRPDWEDDADDDDRLPS